MPRRSDSVLRGSAPESSAAISQTETFFAKCRGSRLPRRVSLGGSSTQMQPPPVESNLKPQQRKLVATAVARPPEVREIQMDKFKYPTSLCDSSQTETIRILDLHPGSGSTPISCTLREVSLLTDPLPQYRAISYCWGESPTSNGGIVCDNSLLHITPNLFDALHRFRSPTEVVSIWADTICINQGDLDEKNQQVPLMGKIYQRAHEVLVWLGAADHDETTEAGRQITELVGFAHDISKEFSVPLPTFHSASANVTSSLALKLAWSGAWGRLRERSSDFAALLKLLRNP